MTAPWISMGDHTGHPRRLARGLRAMCRPAPEYWQGDFTDRETTTRDVIAWLTTLDRPSGDVVAWVPGHDGTPGPGAELAGLVSTTWSLPLHALVQRHSPIRSAHAAGTRPDHREQLRTLTATSGSSEVIVVDNAAGSGASMSATVDALQDAGHRVTAIVTVTRASTRNDRDHRNVCGLCHAVENVDCTGTSTNHIGRAWRLRLTSPGCRWLEGLGDRLSADGGACRPTIEETYLWDHTRRDNRFPTESAREAILYRGACIGCGWAGPTRRDNNTAVEDAHDHSWPGWRQLPIVPRRPDEAKPEIKWRAQLTALYRATGLDVEHWLAPGAPYRTARLSGGINSYSRTDGSYDICGVITERVSTDTSPAHDSEQQLALW